MKIYCTSGKKAAKCHQNSGQDSIISLEQTISGPCLLLIDFDQENYSLPTIPQVYPTGLTAWVDFAEKDTENPIPFLSYEIGNDGQEKIELRALTEDDADGLLPVGAYFLGEGLSLSPHQILAATPDHLQLLPLLPSSKGSTPALFLDRDGIINEDTEYLYHPDELVLRPGIEKLIAHFNKNKLPVICLTNQSGVARGMFTIEQVEKLHLEINYRLQKLGARIDHFEISPFHFEKGKGPFKKRSITRKPGPGMLLKACRRFPIDLKKSYMLGDKDSDKLYLAPMRTFLIPGPYPLKCQSAEIVNNFDEVLHKIIN